MKNITFEEFAKLPIIGSNERQDKKFEVKHGDELVTFVKSIVGLIGVLRINDIDTMGCSTTYIYEKIQLAIHDLEWMRNRVAEIKDETILCINCGEYADLDDNNLCFNCREDQEED